MIKNNRFLKHLFIYSLIFIFTCSFQNKNQIKKIIIYKVPFNIMFYASVTENDLKKTHSLQKDTISNSKKINKLNHIICKFGNTKEYSLKVIDIRIIIEGYDSNNKIILKIAFDKWGAYQYLGNCFYEDKTINKTIEELIPDVKFIQIQPIKE